MWWLLNQPADQARSSDGADAVDATVLEAEQPKPPDPAVQECWAHRQDRGGGSVSGDWIDHAMTADEDGYVYVTHPKWLWHSVGGWNFDIVTKKLAPDGTVVWQKVYDGGALYGDPNHPGDVPRAIAVDNQYVYVAGQALNVDSGISGNDAVLIRYDRQTDSPCECVAIYDYDDEDDEAYAVTACGGYAYVTGESKHGPDDGDNDVFVMKVRPSDCYKMRVKRYDNGGADYASAIVADGSCNVYAAGGSWVGAVQQFNFLVLSYSSGGTLRWANSDYDGPGAVEGPNCYDYARDLAICGGVVYAAGQVCAGIGGLDYAVVAYDSADGDIIGDDTYGGAGNDRAWGVAADSSCHVYVTGGDENPDLRLTTLKYDWLLHRLAANQYSSASEGRDITVDACGNPYATGSRIYDDPDDPSNFITIRYTHNPNNPNQLEPAWVTIQSHVGYDEAYVIRPYGCETVYVTGESEGSDGAMDIVTKKYSERGACFDCLTGQCVDNVASADCRGQWQIWDKCGVCSQYDPPYPQVCTVACSLPDGSCIETTVIECLQQPGAQPGPIGSECEGGACCLPDGRCLFIKQERCQAEYGGRYLGDGIPCTPTACMVPVDPEDTARTDPAKSGSALP